MHHNSLPVEYVKIKQTVMLHKSQRISLDLMLLKLRGGKF